MHRTRTALCVLVAGAGIAAIPASPAQAASANRFTCRAEALQASVFGQGPLLPLGAGSTTGSCGRDVGGGAGAGQATLPLALGLDGAYAATDVAPSAGVAPALQTGAASSGVVDARLDPTGSLVRLQGVRAESNVSCVNGAPRFASTGRVDALSVAGQSLPIQDGTTTVATTVGGLTQLAVTVRLNEETQDASGYTFRAVHVTAPADGSVINVSAGVNVLGAVGSPCTDFESPVPVPVPVPVPGRDAFTGTKSLGGGLLIDLDRLPIPRGYEYLRKSPCMTSSAFGRRVGLIGDSHKNRITGSKLADRIFGFESRDRLNGGDGSDCIEGGKGSDIENGGTKSDMLFGREDRDYLDGGAGNDKLYAGAGNDLISTGTGHDRVDGGTGNDRILGRDGSDVLKGGAGNDVISAATGGARDRISCGSGRDLVRVDPRDKVARDCEKVIVLRGKTKKR